MWVSALKWAAKAAIAMGLHKKALGWITKKLEGSEDKAIKKLKKVSEVIDEVYAANPDNRPTAVEEHVEED